LTCGRRTSSRPDTYRARGLSLANASQHLRLMRRAGLLAMTGLARIG
jgi:hypothetical protein